MATVTDVGLAARMQALSDEHRLTILRELAAGPKCVRDLTNRLEDGQSLVSFHRFRRERSGQRPESADLQSEC